MCNLCWATTSIRLFQLIATQLVYFTFVLSVSCGLPISKSMTLKSITLSARADQCLMFCLYACIRVYAICFSMNWSFPFVNNSIFLFVCDASSVQFQLTGTDRELQIPFLTTIGCLSVSVLCWCVPLFMIGQFTHETSHPGNLPSCGQ